MRPWPPLKICSVELDPESVYHRCVWSGCARFPCARQSIATRLRTEVRTMVVLLLKTLDESRVVLHTSHNRTLVGLFPRWSYSYQRFQALRIWMLTDRVDSRSEIPNLHVVTLVKMFSWISWLSTDFTLESCCFRVAPKMMTSSQLANAPSLR